MEKMAESDGGLVVRGRVEIDMRQPFKSVKEAISLFGEKVLAGEIYATKLKETKTKVDQEQHQLISSGAATIELHEEKKEITNKPNEDENLLAFYLNSLKQELEETKKELQQIKTREKSQQPAIINPEIEELKFVETPTNVEVKTQTESNQEFALQKKRSVKFASPPLLTRVIVTKEEEDDENADLESPSFEEKKKKKKPLIPMFGAFFSKKKGAHKLKSKSFKI